MGKKSSARHISEVGNYGDAREHYASKYVFEHAQPNDPDAILRALEMFDIRWTMLHLGTEKGEYLDMALKDLIIERRAKKMKSEAIIRSRPDPIRVLEVGAYIGYSAIRMGRILVTEAEQGSTLLSVEQNLENAKYAKIHVEYAGLNNTVKVLHSRIENCFGELPNETEVWNNDNRPYDFVFFDHRKPFYLRDLKMLESRGYIDASTTTLVADNVASLEHLKNREEAIARGKRKGSCKCANNACNYLDYVRKRWSSTEIFYGNSTKDGISISKPASGSNLENLLKL